MVMVVLVLRLELVTEEVRLFEVVVVLEAAARVRLLFPLVEPPRPRPPRPRRMVPSALYFSDSR